MSEILKTFQKIVAPWTHYQRISSLLSWDQETYMPLGAAEQRSEQLALIAQKMQEVFLSEELRHELSKWVDLNSGGLSSGLSDSEGALLKKTYKRWRDANQLPVEFVTRWAKTTSQAQFHWQEARAQNQFSVFAPYLKTLIDMVKERAAYIAPGKNPYDLCLDDYEAGLSIQDCESVFFQLKQPLLNLLKEMTQKTASFPQLKGLKVPVQDQWDFGMMVIKDIGFDLNRGRQDKSAHPFTIDMGRHDVRITTRVSETNFSEAFSSTIHELGHGLYEQGLPEAWQGLPLAESVSLGIHESQSRFWENMIAKRPSFWTHYFPQLQRHSPAAFSKWGVDDFVKALHHVQPGLIRVDADEISYCLHVMLRFDCERALILEGLDVNELPAFWNQKMQDYLGVLPDTDAMGVLQDVHWSAGLFGYFPTYALGSIYAAQLWDQLTVDIPNVDADLSHGKFENILNWLQTRVHQHGSLYEPKDLIQKITGKGLDVQPYLSYLTQKYHGFS